MFFHLSVLTVDYTPHHHSYLPIFFCVWWARNGDTAAKKAGNEWSRSDRKSACVHFPGLKTRLRSFFLGSSFSPFIFLFFVPNSCWKPRIASPIVDRYTQWEIPFAEPPDLQFQSQQPRKWQEESERIANSGLVWRALSTGFSLRSPLASPLKKGLPFHGYRDVTKYFGHSTFPFDFVCSQQSEQRSRS